MKPGTVGVLVMAYGSPRSLNHEDVATYLRHITQHYRKAEPDAEAVRHLKERYQAIGGSPLYAITERIAAALERALDSASPARFRVYTAMKHSPPFIEEAVAQMARDSIGRAIGVALAPFRSRLSTGSYYHAVEAANAALDRPMRWSFIYDLYLHPLFAQLWQRRIEDVRPGIEGDPLVLFTNHSLPARIEQWGDPYVAQFEAAAQVLAERCRLSNWTTAYQSRGGGREPWLGPDLAEVLAKRAREGCRSFLVAPIGFLMDHLEVLYDIDIDARRRALEMGIQLARTRMPNDDPLLVAMLADLVRRRGPIESAMAK